MTFRLAEEEKNLIQAYARLHVQPAAQIIRTAILERFEDEFDLRELDEAISKNDGVFYSHDEIMREFGLR
jgi:hypothetical protein